jgi:hypothetical protein
MVAEIYDIANSMSQPGLTLRATSDVASLPATDDRWIRFVFSTPYTPAIGEWVFIVFENTAAVPATNFPQILNGSAAQTALQSRRIAQFSTVNGYSTNGTGQGELPHVIVQGSNTYGQPITALGSVATFTGRRGILIGPEWKSFLPQRVNFNPGTANNRLQIFELSEPPTGTPIVDLPIVTAFDGLVGSMLFNFDFSTLSGSGPWVLCTNTASSLAFGSLGLIEGYSDYPAIFDALYDNFAMCPSVIQSGSTWVVNRDRAGGMTVELDGLATPSPGPSSGGLLSQGFIF